MKVELDREDRRGKCNDEIEKEMHTRCLTASFPWNHVAMPFPSFCLAPGL